METLKVSYRIIWIGENKFTIFLAPERIYVKINNFKEL